VRTIVTFESKKFNQTEVLGYFINPRCFGDDLCKWLIKELKSQGLRCDEKPEQEDSGWFFSFWKDANQYRLISGLRPPDEKEPGLWLVWVERPPGFLGWLFGKRDVDPTVPRQIHKLLSDSPEISNIHWHLQEDFDSGQEQSATNAPD